MNKMHKNSRKQYFLIALLLSLAIGITINFPLVMRYLFGAEEGRHGERFIITFSHLGSEILITFIMAFLMFTLNFFILKPVDLHRKLHMRYIALAISLTVVSVYVLNSFFYSIKGLIDTGPRPMGHRDEFDFINFFVSALVVGCVLIIRLIYQKQMINLENESLRREALQSQFESLKNQLSPHFLFNSLTALKTLSGKLRRLLRIMSTIYQKLFDIHCKVMKNRLVTLKEEMVFMESYLYLIRMRFDTNLSVSTNLNENYLSYRLPPLTIQTLVENAIKHNEISKEKPLIINIYNN